MGITKPLFVDYGSGEGDVLEVAKNTIDADVLGFEFRENAVNRANEKIEKSPQVHFEKSFSFSRARKRFLKKI